MADQGETVQAICASLERDVGINLHDGQVRVDFSDHHLLLEGEVDSIAAKRRAVLVAAQRAGDVAVEDRLSVRPAQAREDGAIGDVLMEALVAEPVFRNFDLAIARKGQLDGWKDLDEPAGKLLLEVDRGVVTLAGEVWSLSHKRFANLLAWWVPGVRNVVNQIVIKPGEDDNDHEINDAVLLALDKDPLVHSEQLSVQTRDHVVTLRGLVATDEEKRMAEDDVWYLDSAVRGVVNEVLVQQVTEGGAYSS